LTAETGYTYCFSLSLALGHGREVVPVTDNQFGAGVDGGLDSQSLELDRELSVCVRLEVLGELVDRRGLEDLVNDLDAVDEVRDAEDLVILQLGATEDLTDVGVGTDRPVRSNRLQRNRRDVDRCRTGSRADARDPGLNPVCDVEDSRRGAKMYCEYTASDSASVTRYAFAAMIDVTVDTTVADEMAE